MKTYYTKKSYLINFKHKNKVAITYKRKKEELIFSSLISDIQKHLYQ